MLRPGSPALAYLPAQLCITAGEKETTAAPDEPAKARSSFPSALASVGPCSCPARAPFDLCLPNLNRLPPPPPPPPAAAGEIDDDDESQVEGPGRPWKPVSHAQTHPRRTQTR